MNGMCANLGRSLSILLLILSLPSAPAQNQRGWLKRDVAVLVDVSASVVSPQQGWQNDYKTQVRRIITGLRASDLGSDWMIDGERDGEQRVAPYYAASMVDGSMPLAEPGNSLFIMRFGDLQTIRDNVLESRELRDIERDSEDYFRVKYPTHSSLRGQSDFRDQKTNLQLAKATVYSMMDRAEGYYLIVVSDEVPDRDPDSALLPEEIAKIRSWESRSDATDIVTLRRKGSDLKITLRAVGFNPDPNRPVQSVERWTPPAPDLAIEFLGGLGRSSEGAPYRPLTDPPYFAWQVEHDSEINRAFSLTLEPMEGQQPPPAAKTNTAFIVYRQADLAGKYRLLVEDRTGGASVAPALPAYIEITHRWDWLPYVAWATGLLSLGVFLYTWWTLRRG